MRRVGAPCLCSRGLTFREGRDDQARDERGQPAGVAVSSFKQPTTIERAHDFLWRTQLALPARGRMGVFSRSHDEEVLVVRVNPELLVDEAIDPARADDPRFWTRRFQDIAPGSVLDAIGDAGREVLPARLQGRVTQALPRSRGST
jgi:Polyphosphate kinase 2 (PPK2)